MGMIYELSTISDAGIKKLLAIPELFRTAIGLDDLDALMEQKKQRLLSRMLGANAAESFNSSAPVDGAGLFADHQCKQTDLEKSWHGVHFFLTGTDWGKEMPLGFLMGGHEVGDIDVGYGPAKVLSSIQVKEVHDALSQLPLEEMASKLDPVSFYDNDIYPFYDRNDADEEDVQYVLHYTKELANFVAEACKQRVGILSWCW